MLSFRSFGCFSECAGWSVWSSKWSGPLSWLIWSPALTSQSLLLIYNFRLKWIIQDTERPILILSIKLFVIIFFVSFSKWRSLRLFLVALRRRPGSARQVVLHSHYLPFQCAMLLFIILTTALLKRWVNVWTIIQPLVEIIISRVERRGLRHFNELSVLLEWPLWVLSLVVIRIV